MFANKISAVRSITCVSSRVHYATNKSTIDQKEIAHFEKFAEEWWDVNGVWKSLHALNNFRVPFVQNQLIKTTDIVSKENINTTQPLKGVSILDVGCGGGIFAEGLAKVGAKVTGLDPNVEVIEWAKKHAKEVNSDVEYIAAPIEEFAKTNFENFDVVVTSEVIEHVNNQDAFLAGCASCVRPGGSLFLDTIAKTYLGYFILVTLFEDVLFVVPKGTHEYEKFIDASRVEQLLQSSGFKTVKIQGTMYNPITNKWILRKPVNTFYSLHSVKSKNI